MEEDSEEKEMLRPLLSDDSSLFTKERDHKSSERVIAPEKSLDEILRKLNELEAEIRGLENKEERTSREEEVKERSAELDEIDYAILKAVSYGMVTFKDLSRKLQIKMFAVEKHVDKLISMRYLRFFKHLILTDRGVNAIADYEERESEEVWKPIDEFITSVGKVDEARRERIQRLVDKALLVAVTILIILIIYFGFF
ncbi:hypothetical protein AIOGIFDO_00657 [Candidatus Methanoperedenaceae archaeon GB37]|nr:hypothetical protein AIOGIFDO_00657 [Candidatus Methanoperedenaceae archaeon GB37]